MKTLLRVIDNSLFQGMVAAVAIAATCSFLYQFSSRVLGPTLPAAYGWAFLVLFYYTGKGSATAARRGTIQQSNTEKGTEDEHGEEGSRPTGSDKSPGPGRTADSATSARGSDHR